jgi:hypothetical protein
METQRVQMKGVLPWLVHWACRAGSRDFYPALAALVSLVKNIFFLTVHFVNLCVLIARQPGQAVVQDRLSLNMSLRLQPRPPPHTHNCQPTSQLFPVKIDDFRLCLLLLIYPWRLNYLCRILAKLKYV